jgi:hypothetical protein
MSRAERRQYQRMLKGQDPYAPPPQRGGGGRRPPRRTATKGPRDWSFNRGFWLKTLGLAAVVGITALSVAWSSGAETALMAGAAGAAAALVLVVGLRLFLQRRSAG